MIKGGALVLPVFHETMPVNLNTVRLAVERKGADALITLDRLRIDVKAEFYVRVKAIDSIKIVQVEGLNAAAGGDSSGVPRDGNLADSAVAAALRYRAQAPVLDGLMKELGFDGSTIGNLVAAAADQAPSPPPPPSPLRSPPPIEE